MSAQTNRSVRMSSYQIFVCFKSVFRSACLSTSVCLFVCPEIPLSVCQPTHLPVFPNAIQFCSVCLSVRPSVYGETLPLRNKIIFC